MDPNLAPQTPPIAPPIVPVAPASPVPSQVTSAVKITDIAPPPEKSGKKKFIVIGIVALLVLLAGAVFALTQTQKPVEPSPESTVTPAATVEPKDETSSWETYQSEKYGFEFKYPSDWYFSPFDEENALFGTHSLHNYDTTKIEEFMDHGILDIERYGKDILKVEISPGERDVDSEEYMTNFLKDSKGELVETDIVIEGVDIKEVDYPSIEAGVFDSLREYFIFPQDQAVRIAVMYKSPGKTVYQDSDLKQIVDKIVSTFKFTN